MRGFTLIELVAVVVILAIVSLVATPIIMDVIDEAETSAVISETNLILKSAETYYMSSFIDGIVFDGKQDLYENIDSSNLKTGSLKITEDGDISLAIYEDDICYNKFYNSEDIKIEKNISMDQCLNKTVDAVNSFDYFEEPINNCYSNSVNLCLGTGNEVSDGKIIITDKVGADYYLSMPFTVNYDKGFTIEYVFKPTNFDENNLNVSYKDIQIMSLYTTNNVELMLFYKSDYTKEFSFYSHSNGYLSGKPHTTGSLTKTASDLNEQVINLSLVYNHVDNTVSQYVNGELNRSVVMLNPKTGTENVIWRNGRYDTNQSGVAGEVYAVRVYDYPLSSQTLLNNYNDDFNNYN